jgi:putative acetyltransferase
MMIRPEDPADHAAIDRVHQLAFGAPGEARLVRALRAQATDYFALVAEEDGEVVGHVAFSEITLGSTPQRSGPGGSSDMFGLAPLAVRPDHQRRGIGDALTRRGLEECLRRGAVLVFVLGHASYYPRFGFRPAAAAGFHWDSLEHDGSFFLLELAPGAAAGRSGWVHYHPVFDLVT